MDTEYKKFIDDSKEYLKLRYSMLRLELLEKMSLIIALFVVLLVSVVLVLVALTYFTMAAIFALREVLGGVEVGFCIMGGLFVLITLLVIIFRKKWIVNPLIKQLSDILFAESEEEYLEDESANAKKE